MDQVLEILLGHAIFASSEYGYHGYHPIAHSISNNTNTGGASLPAGHPHPRAAACFLK